MGPELYPWRPALGVPRHVPRTGVLGLEAARWDGACGLDPAAPLLILAAPHP